MKQAKIIFNLFLPADKDPSKSIHPAVRALNYPATRFKTNCPFDCLGLFSSGFDMSRIKKLLNQRSDIIIIIAFIKAQVLRVPQTWLRSLYSNTFYGSLNHLHVVTISPVNGNANGDSSTLTQKASFNAFFGPVGRVWPCFFFRPTGLWSWSHPWTAMSNQCLARHHTATTPCSIIAEKHLHVSIVETTGVPRNCDISLWRSRHSTGILCAKQKISRPLLSVAEQLVCDSQADAVCREATRVQSFPITHLVFATYHLQLVLSLWLFSFFWLRGYLFSSLTSGAKVSNVRRCYRF